jgi:hypothetical protein
VVLSTLIGVLQVLYGFVSVPLFEIKHTYFRVWEGCLFMLMIFWYMRNHVNPPDSGCICLLQYCKMKSTFLTPVTCIGHVPDKNGLCMDEGKPCLYVTGPYLQTRQNCSLTWAWWISMIRPFWIMHPRLNRIHNLPEKEVAWQLGWGGGAHSQILPPFFAPKSNAWDLTSAHLNRWVTMLSGYQFKTVHKKGDQTLHVDVPDRLPLLHYKETRGCLLLCICCQVGTFVSGIYGSRNSYGS